MSEPKHAIDLNGELAAYLTDPKRKIPKAHLKVVCKKGEEKVVKPEQCRYVGTTPYGCWCAKNTSMKETLDSIVTNSRGGARGDNCPGFGEIGDLSVGDDKPTSKGR